MYDEYREYVGKHFPPNRFFRLADGELESAEQALGFRFPNQLRRFYEDIGYGFLEQGKHDNARDPSIVNRVIPPSEVVELLLDETSNLRPDGGFEEGELPFFDLGDRVYLVLKPNLANPNRVFWLNGEVLSESVVEFFDKLYKRAGFYQES